MQFFVQQFPPNPVPNRGAYICTSVCSNVCPSETPNSLESLPPQKPGWDLLAPFSSHIEKAMFTSSSHKKLKLDDFQKFSSDSPSSESIISTPSIKKDIADPSLKVSSDGFKYFYQKELDKIVSSFSSVDSNLNDPINPLKKKFENITRLSIIDFDNTLFCSPLPNSDIWDSRTIGLLKGDLGWFLDSRTLQKPYLNNVKKRWIKDMESVSIAEINRPDTLCVLLTGRSDYIYHDIIRDLLSKRDLNFDMVILKENPDKAWDPNFFEGSGVDKADVTARNKELGVFASKATNIVTFDFKMDVIKYILLSFPTIDSIYMWDDRQNHCSRMQTYLENNYLKTRRIKDVKVHKVDQNTIYMEPGSEIELVKLLISDHNDFVDSENLNNEGTHSKCKKDDPSLNRLKIEQLVRYTSVILDQGSSEFLDKIFKTPKYWRKSQYQLFLGKGEIDDLHLAKSLGDYKFVNIFNQDPEYALENLKSISLGDKVEIDVDGVGFIPQKIYGLRILKTLTYPKDYSHKKNGLRPRRVKKVYIPGRALDVMSVIDKDNYFKPSGNSGSYLRFLPLTFHEAGGSVDTDITHIKDFIGFDSMNAENLNKTDKAFGSELTKIVNLDELSRRLIDGDLMSKNDKILRLTGHISPVYRSSVVPEVPTPKKNTITKSPVSLGNLIKEIWGDEVTHSKIGIAKSIIETEMLKSGIANSVQDLESIKRLISELDPLTLN
ncbi:hypothetical protein AYI68_g2509 [Smittium mucronatum]|uniref:Swiss Army Knife RNA repair protein HAD domain-containing protein n=1 Tax=Smittium mucronatum TaxID=133383 RepID=A0A1R0H2H1_9FUNG|nr:hypothetical protein AYI68_g2509 [Smittium mucronatum]